MFYRKMTWIHCSGLTLHSKPFGWKHPPIRWNACGTITSTSMPNMTLQASFSLPWGALLLPDFGSLLDCCLKHRSCTGKLTILPYFIDKCAWCSWPKANGVQVSTIRSQHPQILHRSPGWSSISQGLMIRWKENRRDSEQQRRRAFCGTSMTFLFTNLSLTSAVFTLLKRI